MNEMIHEAFLYTPYNTEYNQKYHSSKPQPVEWADGRMNTSMTHHYYAQTLYNTCKRRYAARRAKREYAAYWFNV